jgi:hypothetical protein
MIPSQTDCSFDTSDLKEMDQAVHLLDKLRKDNVQLKAAFRQV